MKIEWRFFKDFTHCYVARLMALSCRPSHWHLRVPTDRVVPAPSALPFSSPFQHIASHPNCTSHRFPSSWNRIVII